ncbi:polysaccharide biosynthesis/export family protein [Pedobacter flavus]|uniref:Polysaccharide biosynthesis/export family protein n=1 Tax=Pedobacter flavus TaxID=3113906 RepID=A0ABU7GXV4_9SPHI|nr:polysaccharide biosynthesis/export family protein [Pedobacter sp. VNH31]MEE1883903.1 polysaccharide biosynthesis/export family protein [Pedobacter sp. VNH31]
MSGLKSIQKILFSLLLVAIISSCNVRRETSLFTSPNDVVTDTITQVYVVNDMGNQNIYTIKTQDRLLIRNLQNKDFLSPIGANSNSAPNNILSEKNQTFEVDSMGNITIPEFGKVSVKGLTRKEATNKIQQLFEKEQIAPIIEITIVNLKVTLLGEFRAQGNYILEQDNLTLIDLIAQAGGLTENADPKTCKIIRGDKFNPEIIYVNLQDIKSLASKKLVLQNSDIIVIQPLKSVVASKKIQNFNNYIQPVLVLLNLGLLILTITK